MITLLSKDIIILLLTKYLPPIDALKFLRTCKYIHDSIDNYIIVTRVMHSKYLDNFKQQLEQFIICDSCGAKIGGKKKNIQKNLIKHMQKHDNGLPIIEYNNHITKCSQCDLPKSKYIQHNCVRLINCEAMSKSYPWIKYTCSNKRWYLEDPNIKNHQCTIICSYCNMFITYAKPIGYINDIFPFKKIKEHMTTCSYKDKLFKLTYVSLL